ncbi:thioredoxin family protein [Paucihalobacter ruber]|uniref:Thioredoxin family protein n=1 Tax=Paucihalobacter ruber TaxID=2567861 RepID=A0A506PN50_9FLAO|nr:thioredoxin family protein [Paucihalobacter ruber]TPV34645.1 thioredoxin family protein [Paucihalobacter ruber]
MDVVVAYSLDHIIKASLKTALTYKEYSELISDLVAIEASSGVDASPALVEYTKLNQKRMARWDKTITISDGVKSRIQSFDKHVTWLVLTETWCGDAAHVIPIINKVAELNPNISLKLVFRDEHPELMDRFLTNGGKSIPKLIMIDNDTNEVVNTFGPRPSEATAMVEDFKSTHGSLTDEFKGQLQAWYNKNKGQNIIEDLLVMLGV